MSTGSRKSPLAAVSGALCFVLVAGGASGLLYEWLGWFRVFGFLRFLVPEGYEVYGYVVMIAAGAVIGAAGERAGR